MGIMFPVQINKMLNASIANFWWGQKEDERRIHWKSWMKLTMAKSLGGLGFKDVGIFNNALLAKQCWRLLNEPDALWAKVMKGIYFHDKSMLEAKKGGRASWAWSSLLIGRDFLKEHMVWQIMDGESVSIWEDRWVYGGSNRKFGNPGLVELQLPEKVAEIMDKNNGEWRLEEIKDWILEEDYKAIQDIPICQQGGKDRLVWPFTKNGEYSVRSGYQKAKIGKNEEINNPSSSHLVDGKVWKIIWGSNLPSKIQNFLWRICSKAIPVGELLWKRRVVRSPVCDLCGKESETVEHMLLVCEWTRGVWFNCCWGLRIEKEKITVIDEWLLQVYERLKKVGREELFTEVGLVCWQIWKIRSEIAVGKKEVKMEEVFPRIKRAVGEYYQYTIKKDNTVENEVGIRIKQKWKAPELGWIKINSDGAFDSKKREAGSGVIARDSEGKVVGVVNRRFTAVCAAQAEAMAIRDAVNLAIERKFQKICLEMDSKELFLNLTNNGSCIDWRIKPLVYDIKELLQLIPDYKVMLIYREANAAADWVARNSSRGMCMSGWVRHLPLSLVRILDKDGLPAPP